MLPTSRYGKERPSVAPGTGWGGVGVGEAVAGEMAPGTSPVRMEKERGDLALDSVVKFGRIPR